LSQQGDSHPDEHAHEPPVLHEHWFASHPQSEQVQFSPQHTHAVAPALLKVARANGVATTALNRAKPANDLINIEISFVKNQNRNKTTRRYSVNESRHKEVLDAYYYLSPVKQFRRTSSKLVADCQNLQPNGLLPNDLDQHYSN
jgi:hypothetical protein